MENLVDFDFDAEVEHSELNEDEEVEDDYVSNIVD
jgi:hypothetical protein